MSYKKKSSRDIGGRNFLRRKRRKFRKLFLNHQIVLTLLANDEIGKHINELEKVLADFYKDGYIDGVGDGMSFVHSGFEAALANIEGMK
jgi:hypothetical protein